MANATVVLVHGAWHGDWCWDLVVKRLGEAGIDVATVDNPSVQSATASLQDDADNVRALLDHLGGPVLLVGHSYGGGVISDAGTHDAVEHLVYLSGFVLETGESVMANELEGGGGSALDGALRVDGDVITLDEEGAIAAFYHDCEPGLARDAVSKLRPQSIAGLGGVTRHAAWREKPATYVVCTDDRGVPVALQRSAAARIGNSVDIAASHSPFLSRPDEVAQLLVQLSVR
jgi:pimeloyl-ACP methyl ester carboxylesterase